MLAHVVMVAVVAGGAGWAAARVVPGLRTPVLLRAKLVIVQQLALSVAALPKSHGRSKQARRRNAAIELVAHPLRIETPPSEVSPPFGVAQKSRASRVAKLSLQRLCVLKYRWILFLSTPRCK
jgi:hypothetical protein